MAGVQRDGGNAHRSTEPMPQPHTTGRTNHLKVTPENVIALAQTFRSTVDHLDAATRNTEQELRLPDDAFLGDPYSKWAIEEFNKHFVDGDNSLAKTLRRLTVEHMQTFNALKAIAEDYGKTDEWNAHYLGEAYNL